MNKQTLDINLLPVIKKKRKGAAILIVIFFILILAIYVFLFIDFYLNKQSIKELSTSEQLLQEEIQLLENKKGSIEQNDVKSLENAVRFIDQNQMSSFILLKNVNDRLPKNSQLTSYNFDEQDIKLQLRFQQMEEVSYYAQKLKELSSITEVKIHSLSLANADDKDEQYLVELTLILNDEELKGAFNKDD